MSKKISRIFYGIMLFALAITLIGFKIMIWINEKNWPKNNINQYSR